MSDTAPVELKSERMYKAPAHKPRKPTLPRSRTAAAGASTPPTPAMSSPPHLEFCGAGVATPPLGRGLQSFPFQLNFSSSVHCITKRNSRMCPGVAQVEL